MPSVVQKWKNCLSDRKLARLTKLQNAVFQYIIFLACIRIKPFLKNSKMESNTSVKIFLVDDDLFSLSMYEQHLRNLGYTNINCFSSGNDCVNALVLQPDIIFLDHDMEGMNGVETLRKIKRFSTNIFVVFVSGQEKIAAAVNSLKYGAFDYIMKGHDEKGLMEGVLQKIFKVREEMKMKYDASLKTKVLKMFANTKFLLLLLAVLFVAALLTGCKTQNIMDQKKRDIVYQSESPDSVFIYDGSYQYTIRRDDKISFSFWNHDDLSVGSIYGIYNSNEVYGKWLMVDANGNITLPEIGNFHIEGMTVIQAEDSLTKYFKKTIVNPVIEVRVLNKEITILGELRNPGKITVDRENNNLLDIIALAGGYEFYANLKTVKVIRQKGASVRMVNIDLTDHSNYFATNIQLHPGDLVLVPSKKCKDFDKRISTIIPIASSTTAAAILLGAF